MTKREAMEFLEAEVNYENLSTFPFELKIEALNIALEALRDKIDEEESPCHNCYDKNCHNCIYSGRI